jgi:hypothetical protein
MRQRTASIVLKKLKKLLVLERGALDNLENLMTQISSENQVHPKLIEVFQQRKILMYFLEQYIKDFEKEELR